MLRMALPTSRPPPSIARLGRWARIPYPSSAPNSATSSSWTSVYTLMSTGRGVRPETWPRDLGARCPRSGGADEERRERPPGRERAPQEATPDPGSPRNRGTGVPRESRWWGADSLGWGGGVRISWGGEMGCMGPKDPAGFSAAPLRLQFGAGQVAGVERPRREVEDRVELRQLVAQLRLVAQTEDQVAARGRLHPEGSRPEAEPAAGLHAHGQAVGQADLRPAACRPVPLVGQRDRLDQLPLRLQLGPALDEHQPVAEEAEAGGRPAPEADQGPEQDGARDEREHRRHQRSQQPVDGREQAGAAGQDEHDAQRRPGEEAGRAARPHEDHRSRSPGQTIPPPASPPPRRTRLPAAIPHRGEALV